MKAIPQYLAYLLRHLP